MLVRPGSARAWQRRGELAAALIAGTLMQVTDRAIVSRWLAGYEAAWRTPGTEGLTRLFTGDATYLQSPYVQPVTGLDAIRRMWEQERESPDEVFTLATDILAVDGPVAVVRAEVRYGIRPARNTATCGSSGSPGRPVHLVRGVALLARATPHRGRRPGVDGCRDVLDCPGSGAGWHDGLAAGDAVRPQGAGPGRGCSASGQAGGRERP